MENTQKLVSNFVKGIGTAFLQKEQTLKSQNIFKILSRLENENFNTI